MEPDQIKALDPIVQDIKLGIKGIETNLMTEITKRDETHGAERKNVLERIDKLDGDWKQAHADLEGRVKDFDAKMGRLDLFGGTEGKTAGQIVTESDLYRDNVKRIVNGGTIKGIPVPGYRKDVFGDAGLGNTPAQLWQSQRLPLVTAPTRTQHIRDLLGATAASSASIEYIRQLTGPWVADAQDPALSGDPEQQEAKKRQDPSFEHAVSVASTIAHYVRVTKQIVQDAGWLRSWIDGMLRRGLDLAEDLHLLYGTGLNGQVTGLMVDNAVQEYDQSEGPADDTVADALRRAMTKLQLEYFDPSGVVLNPLAWEAIELTKDGEERYVWFFGPRGLDGTPTIWRLPVVVTPAIQPNDYLLGDFAMGASLFDWEDATITVGYIDDDFVRNQLAILAEERIIFTRQLPRAFVRGTINVLTSS